MFSLRSIVAALAIVVGLTALQSQAVFAATAPVSDAAAVETFAKGQIDKPFRIGSEGMRRYDCSGLVYRTFLETGLLKEIGGNRKLARGYFRWFKRQGRVSRHNPQPGDLVVWGKRGHPIEHIGIYIGRNKHDKPVAISALINPWGVSRHKVHALPIPFRGYLHVNIER